MFWEWPYTITGFMRGQGTMPPGDEVWEYGAAAIPAAAIAGPTLDEWGDDYLYFAAFEFRNLDDKKEGFRNLERAAWANLFVQARRESRY